MGVPRIFFGFIVFILVSCPWITTSALSISLGDELVNIGLNFTGSNSNQTDGRVPPDTMGAVGPSSFVELLTERYAVYDKGSGALLKDSTLNQFWTSAGVAPKGDTLDPRVVFDPFSGRYFASSADGLNATSNNLLLAVSNSSDPTQGWTGFSIKSDPTEQRKADFPTLGFNSQGVYVSATMNAQIPGSQISSLLAVPKTDLLAAVPTVANATLFSNTGTGFATQPAIDLDSQRLSATLLHSNPGFTDHLLRVDTVGDIRAATLSSPAQISFRSGFPFIEQVSQPPPGLILDHMNRNGLATNVVIQNNSVWGVQTVQANGQAALHWFQVDLNTNKTLQEGLIQKPGLNFFYGSIAVNKAGDVVIGFSGSGPSQFASAYAVAGITRGGVTGFGDPMLLQQGVASYQSSGGNRWGDYSATTLDPSDPKSFWTIQEWASGMGTWATQITQIRFADVVSAPEPTTFLLVGSGLLGLAGWHRRKKSFSLVVGPALVGKR